MEDRRRPAAARSALRPVDARAPPGPPPRDGFIEAIARTLILGFRDDVVVRVRPTSDGTRIDVRSASRYGRHDLGTNAARVRKLIDDIDDVLVRPRSRRPRRRQQNLKHRPSHRRSDRCRGSRPVRRSRRGRARRFLEMGQHREPGSAGEARIEPDIDRSDQGRNVGLALVEPMQDRGFAAVPVAI